MNNIVFYTRKYFYAREVTDYLTHFGYQVLTFWQSKELYESLEQNPAWLVIVDYDPGDENWVVFFEHLWQAKKKSGTRILALWEGKERKLEPRLIDFYLEKPVVLNDLKGLLERIRISEEGKPKEDNRKHDIESPSNAWIQPVIKNEKASPLSDMATAGQGQPSALAAVSRYELARLLLEKNESTVGGEEFAEIFRLLTGTCAKEDTVQPGDEQQLSEARPTVPERKLVQGDSFPEAEPGAVPMPPERSLPPAVCSVSGPDSDPDLHGLRVENHYLKAYVHYLRGRKKSALIECRMALDLDPGFEKALRLLKHVE
ncbi:MAG: hypothetical protein PHQ23_08505 [Candidatus Wallbacteria bacterium]|nr:hypothetical protein [Candidatus Wallbacteria bacterium]